MHHYDLIITKAINSLAGQNPTLDTIFVYLTSFGVPLMVIAVVAQWWRLAGRVDIRHALVASGLTFLLGLALNQVIILVIHRVRPYDAGLTHLLIPPSTDFSFPSDHATASFAIVFGFFAHGLKRWGTAFLIAATFICLSRIFVGTHYFTDILGGVLTAALAALVVKYAYRRGTRFDRLVTGVF